MRTAKTIRLRAEQLLKKEDVKAPPVPVEKIARNLGAQLRYTPFKGDLSGMVFRKKHRIIIGVNSFEHPNRQRFTIAHEIGHMLLHKGKEVYIDRAYRVNLRNTVSSEAIDEDEIEANRFAAELLMPYFMIKRDVKNIEIDLENDDDLKELARKYAVSRQALTFRIINLFPKFFSKL